MWDQDDDKEQADSSTPLINNSGVSDSSSDNSASHGPGFSCVLYLIENEYQRITLLEHELKAHDTSLGILLNKLKGHTKTSEQRLDMLEASNPHFISSYISAPTNSPLSSLGSTQ